MSEEELIETLRAFEKNRVEQLEEPAKNLFYAIMKIADERDRLNNIINKKEQFLGDNIKRLEREVVKRDNIINELEKWLRSEIKRIEELQNPAKSKVKPYGEEYNNYTLIIGAYDNVLDKLQELKGSDK